MLMHLDSPSLLAHSQLQVRIGEQLETSEILLEGAVLSEGNLERFYSRSVKCHGSSNVPQKTSVLSSFYRY